MKFLIDECLHASLVEPARARSHEASHVNWLGLGGTADWKLMSRIVAEDFVFVTNNARDFRRLYAAEPWHAGLVIIIPQVPPAMQVYLFEIFLDGPALESSFVNEAFEILFEGDRLLIERYPLFKPSA